MAMAFRYSIAKSWEVEFYLGGEFNQTHTSMTKTDKTDRQTDRREMDTIEENPRGYLINGATQGQKGLGN